MKIGQLVMLIGSDGYMPPFGSIGRIVSEFDEDGDCDVMFPDHPWPCPFGEDLSWVAHRSWLMPLDDDNQGVMAESLKPAARIEDER